MVDTNNYLWWYIWCFLFVCFFLIFFCQILYFLLRSTLFRDILKCLLCRYRKYDDWRVLFCLHNLFMVVNTQYEPDLYHFFSFLLYCVSWKICKMIMWSHANSRLCPVLICTWCLQYFQLSEGIHLSHSIVMLVKAIRFVVEISRHLVFANCPRAKLYL